MRYLIVDTANTFFRARHSAHRQSDMWDKLGFAIHVTLASVNKAWREQKADHVVFCLEGRSWRKDYYEPYKKNRAVARAALTETEAEEDRLFWEAFDDLKTFLSQRTNCTVLRHDHLEADDLVAGWIQSHPEDHHTIVSTDSDFVQLIADNVNLFNGINDHLFTTEGAFDAKGRKLAFTVASNSKIKVGKPDADFVTPPNYQDWILFLKCVRGDPGDNVFSAYPGVRVKGTKNKVGITEAFEDKDRQGFSWNNLMLQTWTDHNNVEHKVLDDYQRNRTLIDLTAQPEHVKQWMAETISAGSVRLSRPMVGAQFLKFCGKYDLVKLSENASTIGEILSAGYPE
jgi:5'-3' exonuclease